MDKKSKKWLIACAALLLSVPTYAQQWNGGANNTTTNINRSGDISVLEGTMSRMTLGSAPGGNPLWGDGYLGFNLRREPNGNWSYLANGSNAGMAVYKHGNNLSFSIRNSTGNTAGNTYTDVDIVNNVVFRIDGTNRTCFLGHDNIQRVAIGPAWGGGMYGEGYVGFNMFRNEVGLWEYKNSGSSNGAFVIWADAGGGLNFTAKQNTNSSQGGSLTDAQILSNNVFKINGDGKVIIGKPVSGLNIQTTSAYKLYVEEGILTERVRVAIKSSAQWADYVFAPSYELMSLSDLEKFVKTNKHLPGVPSAQEVVENGVDVASMDAILLKKVEELTLYTIELKKEIELLKKQR
ncbi:MAG: hypothetical protein EOP48_16445 [Sphingobacteriales bacterium]|nr:MAG: hypothetical protein EOP48_16445 [Sphingobacteriales bacterium]